MSVPPESLEGGKCYLTLSGEVRRVLRLLPEARVHYETRLAAAASTFGWKEGVLELTPFAALIEREVSCDWMLERDGEEQGMRQVPARRTNRGDIIQVLNRLVRERVIVSFQTDLFDKWNRGRPLTVAVTVKDQDNPEPALQLVRDALVPLGREVVVLLSTWQSGGRS